MTRRRALLVLILFAQGIFAAAAEREVDRSLWTIYETLEKVRGAGQQCASCGFDFAGRSDRVSPACRSTYRDFFKIRSHRKQETRADSEVNINIAFGYTDNRTDIIPGDPVQAAKTAKAVHDHYEKSALFERLRVPCPSGIVGACGFKYEADDADVLVKKIKMIGPDGYPRFRTIRIRAKDSALTDDDLVNRGPRLEEQLAKSEETQQFFEESLGNADMVMYMGHARGGGGPDFAPPRLRKVNSRIQLSDLNWYRRNHPGTDRMYGALAEARRQPKIIAIFACYSKDLFYQGLRKVAPRSALILSGNNEEQTALAQAVATLDSVLGARCEEDFRQSLDSIDRYRDVFDRSEIRVTPVKVDGLFKGQ